jgi:2-oxoglutarate ferredoxin oxidoreductase subunit alpha
MADCRVYVAYPMTPASTVLSTLAGWEKKTGMVVRHAEDEIAVVLTALGSSAMGGTIGCRHIGWRICPDGRGGFLCRCS